MADAGGLIAQVLPVADSDAEELADLAGGLRAELLGVDAAHPHRPHRRDPGRGVQPGRAAARHRRRRGVLAAASKGTVRLWDPATGDHLRTLDLTGHGTVWDVAFSPDGRLLATVSNDGTVRLWN